jgi:DNA (cytosine-5)-methyltransferase 1
LSLGRAVETQADLAYSLNAPSGGGRRQELNVAAPISFPTEFSNQNIDEDMTGTLHRRAHSVTTGMAVRRLTPRECERLQGFPDDYTLIPYRNKPAADGPRYRALGNSMAVPVLRWIGERIEKVLAAHAGRKDGAA